MKYQKGDGCQLLLETYSGNVIITALEANAPNGDNATFTASFEGVGALSKAA